MSTAEPPKRGGIARVLQPAGLPQSEIEARELREDADEVGATPPSSRVAAAAASAWRVRYVR
ncbi:hypothetical protein GCM10020001_016710 [Nonomuraea salmonea]